MNRFLLILLFVLAGATDTLGITLAQALQMAQEHSHSVRKAQAQSSGALSELGVARAERYPTLSAVGTAFYVSEIPQLTIAAGPTTITRDMGTDQTYQADFRLSVPLFTGGRISGVIDIAQASADYYSALLSADRDRVAFLTRVEYFGLIRADRQIMASHAAYGRACVIQTNVRGLYEAGAADSVNLLETALAVSKATTSLAQAESGRRTAEIRLASLLGVAIATAFLTTDSLTAVPIPDTTNAQIMRAELAAADAGIKLSRSKLSVARADYFPILSAFGGYSYGKPNLDRFNDAWNDYFTVGANLTWSFNLGNRTSRKSRAARFAHDAAGQERLQIEEILTRDADLYFEQLKFAHTRYQSAVTETEIARANYALAESQYLDGALAANRLLEIAADLNSAEALLAVSLADYHLALSAYYYAIGSENLRRGL